MVPRVYPVITLIFFPSPLLECVHVPLSLNQWKHERRSVFFHMRYARIRSLLLTISCYRIVLTFFFFDWQCFNWQVYIGNCSKLFNMRFAIIFYFSFLIYDIQHLWMLDIMYKIRCWYLVLDARNSVTRVHSMDDFKREILNIRYCYKYNSQFGST